VVDCEGGPREGRFFEVGRLRCVGAGGELDMVMIMMMMMMMMIRKGFADEVNRVRSRL
jgi:hypothetical protein